MHIVCPHCTTSYAIDLATLGAAGRTVRCSRCKEVWLARPEDAIEDGAGAGDGRQPAQADAQADAAAEWEAPGARGRQPGPNSCRRQPLDLSRLAGRRCPTPDPMPTGPRWPQDERGGRRRGARRQSWFRSVPAAAGVAAGAAGQALRQPADRLRRHGRAGAGAGRSGASTWCGCCRRPRRSTKWSGSR